MPRSRRIDSNATGDPQPKPRREVQSVCEPRSLPPTILVVDDDDDIRAVISEVLRSQGYSVIEASNGAQAEHAALKEIPQLILMDIGMPGGDGLGVVWRMRSHSEIVNVPVVIVSAYDAYDLRGEAASQGCRGYLRKPLDIEELLALVDEIVRT